MKKILVMLLVLAMCTGMLFGCKKEPAGNDTPTTEAPGNDTPSGDGLEGYDFGGETFNILTRSETSYEHEGNGSGDTVEQAVYRRNEAVSNRFGVTIGIKSVTGGYDNRDDFVTAVRAEQMTSTKAYDLLSTHSVYLGWFVGEDTLIDLASLPGIDVKKEYWNQNLYNELNIDGSCYILIGDIGYTLYEYISVMFANTDILDRNEGLVEGGIEGIYDMIDEGTWTWGALYEIASKYGDGSAEGGDGNYGLLFNTHAMRAAMVAQDAVLFERNAENNRFYMPSVASDHLVNAVQNLSLFFSGDNAYFVNDWGTGEKELNPIFSQGMALFYGQILGHSQTISEGLGNKFTVLPLPKFDTFQSNYYTICRDTVTAVAVMNVVKDKTMSGVITQALCMYGAKEVTPEYYEKALKLRYLNDPKCAAMLDVIRNSLTIVAVPTYFETGIDIDMFREIVMNGTKEGISGKYGGYVSEGNTLIENFYKKIEAIKGS